MSEEKMNETTKTKTIREFKNMEQISGDIVSLLEEITLHSSPTNHFASSPEIVEKRSQYGWIPPCSIVLGFSMWDRPCSTSQIVVDPKKDAVYVMHEGGPITPDSLNTKIESSNKPLSKISSSFGEHAGMMLNNDDLRKFYENLETLYKNHNVNRYSNRYSLSALQKIVSKEYLHTDLLDMETQGFYEGKVQFKSSGGILSIICGEDTELARKYLNRLIHRNLVNSTSSPNNSLMVAVRNPFEKLNIKNPFAAFIKFDNEYEVGFNIASAYDKEDEFGYTMIAINLKQEPTDREEEFNMAESYLVAEKFIPPALIEQYKKDLLAYHQKIYNENWHKKNDGGN